MSALRLLVHTGLSRGGGGGPGPGPATRGGPAIHHDTGWTTTSGNQNLGWRFTVGTNPITVTHLRYYNASGTPQAETIRLYRRSDGTLLASAVVTASTGWAEEEITPVTLSAGQDYVVAHDNAGATRTYYRAPAGRLLDPGITLVGGVFGSGATLPSDSTATELLAASFRTVASDTGYRFYRLAVSANNGRSTLNIAEFELRETGAGSNLATGAVAWADPFLTTGFDAPAAIDTNPSTFWSTPSSVTAGVLELDVGSGNEFALGQYKIQARGDAADGAPKAWVVQASADLDSWTTLDTQSSETGWSNGEKRTFDL